MPDRAIHSLAGLILAAGSSSRMGQPKQLLPWQNTTLLGHTVQQLQNVVNDVYVVVGARHTEIRSSITNTNVQIIHNREWKKGMGASIAKGMAYLSTTTSYDAVLIVLVDQPLLGSEYYQKMLACFSKGKHPVVATGYAENCGVPAIFDRSLFQPLQNLPEEYGAKKLIGKYKAQRKCLEAEGAQQDIDTPEVYEQLYKTWGRK